MKILLMKIILLSTLSLTGYSQGLWFIPSSENWYPNGRINAIGVFNGLAVGGNFTMINGVSCQNVYAANMTIGTNGEVFALERFNNSLIVGGTFSTAGSNPANNIVSWDGTSWDVLGSGISGSVNCLATDGASLYAGGSFSVAGGNVANNIAKWDGTTWAPLSSGTDNTVYALKMYNGNLYVAGSFTNAGGIVCNKIAVWDGNNWSQLGTGIIGTCVYALEFGDLDVLYAGGNFYSAGGLPVRHLALWDGLEWHQPATFDSTVYALAYYSNDGVIIAGGEFTTVCNNARSYVVKEVENCPSQTISGLNGKVRVLNQNLLGMNYKLYAGGEFTASETHTNVPYLAEYMNSTNINTIESEFSTVTLFPNPANTTLNIVSDEDIRAIDIYNQFGETMPYKTDEANRINIEHLENGVYFIEIRNNNGIQRGKFVKI